MASQRREYFASDRIQDLRRFIGQSDGKPLSVRAEGGRRKSCALCRQDLKLMTCICVPNLKTPVVPHYRCESLAVLTKPSRGHIGAVYFFGVSG
jgi:hypothetical protein